MDTDESQSGTDPSAVDAPTVAEAVVDCMLDRGIDVAFGIPGKQTLPLNRALGGVTPGSSSRATRRR